MKRFIFSFLFVLTLLNSFELFSQKTPVTLWSSYYGGSGNEFLHKGGRNTVDSKGNIYIICGTNSTTNIATGGAYQTSRKGNWDVYLAKFSPNGSLLWATYYGGTGDEYGRGVKTDKKGNVYISGRTESGSGIATSGAHQTTYGGGGGDCFLASFDSIGNLRWSTYLGGNQNDGGNNLAIDSAENIILVGSAGSNGITTSGAFRSSAMGGHDLYVAKFNQNGSLIWSSYFGGNASGETIYSATTDSSMNIYLVGYTTSTSLFATSGAHQTSNFGNEDAFLIKLNSSGSLQWSTYYGGTQEDDGWEIVVDKNQNPCLIGSTSSSTNISTSGVYQSVYSGSKDAYIAKFSPSGSRIWGGYFGGNGFDETWGGVLDADENILISGYTQSTTGIGMSGIFNSTYGGGTNDAFIF